jgi:hypothetical protein
LTCIKIDRIKTDRIKSITDPTELLPYSRILTGGGEWGDQLIGFKIPFGEKITSLWSEDICSAQFSSGQ